MNKTALSFAASLAILTVSPIASARTESGTTSRFTCNHGYGELVRTCRNNDVNRCSYLLNGHRVKGFTYFDGSVGVIPGIDPNTGSPFLIGCR